MVTVLSDILPGHSETFIPQVSVKHITDLHRQLVIRWHEQDVDNPYEGLFGIICTQFSYNFLLWHEEDIARSRDVTDEKIAQVKRNIDSYNQQRNDWIEKIDDWITEELAKRHISPAPDAPQNTETPGSTIDRLSIMALRIYHMQEQLQRSDATPEHLAKVQQKLAICHEQHEDLSLSLEELLGEIFSGRKRHKTYRALKMYNDPTLNPYLYRRRTAA